MGLFIMMVGIPGSGKSTVANRYSDTIGIKVYSSDEYRKKILGNEEDQSNNRAIFNALERDIEEAFRKDEDVIFDATNITRKNRIPWVNKAKKYGYITKAVVMTTKLDECISRNNKRGRVVPQDVIVNMVKRYECPHYCEGFDDILLYKEDSDDVSTSLYDYAKDTMANFDQKTKYHKYTLGEHTSKLMESYGVDRCIERDASFWHDVGKMYTQSFDENGNAHYIGHANCSAYLMVSHRNNLYYLNDIDFLECVFIVNEHMHIRDILKGKEETINKYKELFGENRFNTLVEFMNNDNNASGRIGEEKEDAK